MKSPFVRSNFRRFDNNAFIRKAKALQTALSQDVFKDVKPAPALLLPLLDEMQRLMNQLPHNNIAVQSQLENLREYINQLLAMQAVSVNLLAKSDLMVLKASGFDIHNEPIHTVQDDLYNMTMLVGSDSIRHSA